MLEDGPPADSNHMQYWIEEGLITDPHYPHTQAMGTWARKDTGTMQIFLDDMDKAILALPIDLGYAIGSDDGRAWVGLTGATGRRYQEQHVIAWQFCEGDGGCKQPMGYCEAFGCNPEHPSPAYGESGSEGPYAALEKGVPHFSHPDPLPSEEELEAAFGPGYANPDVSHYTDARAADAEVQGGMGDESRAPKEVVEKSDWEIPMDVDTSSSSAYGGLGGGLKEGPLKEADLGVKESDLYPRTGAEKELMREKGVWP